MSTPSPLLRFACSPNGQARRKRDSEHGETNPDPAPNENMLMMRLLGPLVNFVNRPWKMYPVGVLFGLGFDTASSIALLAISALAKNGRNNTRILPSEVIILSLLFTTGMTLVDSLDSVLMLYSYTGFADHSWRIFEPRNSPSRTGDARSGVSSTEARTSEAYPDVNQSRNEIEIESKTVDNAGQDTDNDAARRERGDRITLVKRGTMSQLSVILTTMSILLAFR
ncbi:NicO-domain-containing protein, partial [Imleria badia]